MAEILWTETARSTLRRLPAKVRGRVLARIEQLAAFPYLGPQMKRRWANYRQLLADKYRIVYQASAEGDSVIIVYIRHQRRKM